MVRKGHRSREKVHLEDNFTQVPNDVLDALARTDLSQNESKIVFLVIRKTFGWHKKTDWISLSQIEEGTGIAKPNVCRSIRSLKRKKIIVRQEHRHIGLQLDYTKWQQSKSATVATNYQYR